MTTLLLYGLPQKSFLEGLTSWGKEIFFLIPEGRPHLWGARELAPQLSARGWPVRLITDNMMAYCLSRGMVAEAIIFSQEDTAEGAWCPTGALVLAIAAQAHAVPVKVQPAAKTLSSPAEPEEALFHLAGQRTAPPGIKGYAPLAELVPWKYIAVDKRPSP